MLVQRRSSSRSLAFAWPLLTNADLYSNLNTSQNAWKTTGKIVRIHILNGKKYKTKI